MPNSVLPRIFSPGNNKLANKIRSLKSMAGGNPQALYNQLMRTNPQFAQFIHNNAGKSPEQIAQENGIDINSVRQFM